MSTDWLAAAGGWWGAGCREPGKIKYKTAIKAAGSWEK
jgi:hypothetical protein